MNVNIRVWDDTGVITIRMTYRQYFWLSAVVSKIFYLRIMLHRLQVSPVRLAPRPIVLTSHMTSRLRVARDDQPAYQRSALIFVCLSVCLSVCPCVHLEATGRIDIIADGRP